MYVLNFRTLFSAGPQIKGWLSGLEFTKMLVRIANREDPYQTVSEASPEAV